MRDEEIWHEHPTMHTLWWRLTHRSADVSNGAPRLESTRFSTALASKFVFTIGQLLQSKVSDVLVVDDVRRWRYYPNGFIPGEPRFTATCRVISVRRRQNLIRVSLEVIDPWFEEASP